MLGLGHKCTYVVMRRDGAGNVVAQVGLPAELKEAARSQYAYAMLDETRRFFERTPVPREPWKVYAQDGSTTRPLTPSEQSAVTAVHIECNAGGRALPTSTPVPKSGLALAAAPVEGLTIGVLLPDVFGEFYSELLRGLDVTARARGARLVISSLPGGPEELEAAVRRIRGAVRGLVVMAPHLGPHALERCLPADMPVVLLGGQKAEGTRTALAIDNHGAACTVVRYLAQTGRRKIAHLAGPAGNVDAAERKRGYVEEMRRSCPGTAFRVVEGGDFSEKSGHDAGQRLAFSADRPDAVFAANDNMALGLMRALSEAGVQVPKDVAVVGFDDILPAGTAGLTSVRVNLSDLGILAVERLLGALTGLRQASAVQMIVPELVPRRSSEKRAPT